MPTSFACVLYRPDRVGESALAHGFAVALAGFAIDRPTLSLAELRGVPGWSVAFYSSGQSLSRFDELDHARDLFEEELPPGLAVRDAAGEEAVVYAVVYSDDFPHDDAWRFDHQGLERHYLHDGEEGLEAGVETLDEAEAQPLDVPDGDADQAFEQALRPHRGTTFLGAELRAAVLPALVGALFEADRKIAIRLLPSDAAAAREEAARLNRTLGRVDGRGGFAPPPCAGVEAPASYGAFAEVYDFEDPSDPGDLYRELSIGAIEGTLHFVRAADITAIGGRPLGASLSAAGLYPVAELKKSALGGTRSREGVLAISRGAGAGSGDDLLHWVEPGGQTRPAGPTFTELLRYLALGYKNRDPIEEDLIGALMLRAKLRSEA